MEKIKCPHCGLLIKEVKCEYIAITHTQMTGGRQGIAYYCPKAACKKIISIQQDPNQ